MKFTDRTIAALKPTDRRQEIPDDKVPGLALRVTEKGVKSWTLRYRVGGGRAGRLRRLTLGSYPAVRLEQARKRANVEKRRVDGGLDPAAEKQAARLGETVGDLAQEFIDRYAKKHKRSWQDDDRYLNAEVLPAWKHRKAKDITRRDVRALIEGIADRGSPISANRCLATIRKMFNWAISQDWLDANPAALLAKPGAERSRDRVLTDDEIRLVWTACDAERPATCALTKLRLLTAQRGGELAQLRWTDVETGWITIPPTVTKNKVAHRVPLTTHAAALLKTLPRLEDSAFVFPGATGCKPLTDVKKAGRRIAAHVLATLQETDPTIKTFDFRGHDLRRTASTKMAEAGIAQADIARVLNHVEGGPRATMIYNRYAYDKEKRVALESWDRILTNILETKADRQPLPFSRKGA